MKIYDVELEVKTPTVITKTQVTNILRCETDIINGSTIRGAFISTLMRNNCYKYIDVMGKCDKCDNKDCLIRFEIKNPKLVFHPFYPVFNEAVTKPSHPFTYECKLCEGPNKIFIAKSFQGYDKLRKFDIKQFVNPKKCKEEHYHTLKSIAASLIYKTRDGFYRKFRHQHSLLDATGINRYLGSVEIGMLYSYVGIAPGTKFRGKIVDKADVLRELKAYGKMKIYVGRGFSRGLGHVEVDIKENKEYFDKRCEEVSKVLDELEGKIIFRSLSPVFNLSYKEETGITSLPIPNPGNLPITQTLPCLSGLVEVSGYSIKTNMPKVKIKAADIGSLFFCKIKEKIEIDEIVQRELFGFEPFSIIGLNILEVYPSEYGDFY